MELGARDTTGPSGLSAASEIRDALRSFSAGLEPGVLPGDLAEELVSVATEIRNLAESVTARCAARVAETRVWEGAGDVSVGHYLASRTGGSATELNRAVATQRRVETMGRLGEAAADGSLSLRQVDEISRAVVVDASSERDLIDLAKKSSLSDLADEARRRRAQALDDEARYEAVRRQRCVRTWVDAEGVGTLLWKTTPDQLGVVKAMIDAKRDELLRDERLREARLVSEPMSWDHAGSDALFDMVTSCGAGSDRGSGRDVQIHYFVSHDAAVRGHVEPGERCEMASVGPVPVSVIRDAMVNDDPFISVLETDGVDVLRVARPGRSMTAAMTEALFVRDPRCVVPGCRRTAHLEAHHTEAFAETGHTTVSELARLCAHHHDLVTHRGFQLEGGPGTWRLRPPGGPDPGCGHDRERDLDPVGTDGGDQLRLLC